MFCFLWQINLCTPPWSQRSLASFWWPSFPAHRRARFHNHKQTTLSPVNRCGLRWTPSSNLMSLTVRKMRIVFVLTPVWATTTPAAALQTRNNSSRQKYCDSNLRYKTVAIQLSVFPGNASPHVKKACVKRTENTKSLLWNLLDFLSVFLLSFCSAPLVQAVFPALKQPSLPPRPISNTTHTSTPILFLDTRISRTPPSILSKKLATAMPWSIPSSNSPTANKAALSCACKTISPAAGALFHGKCWDIDKPSAPHIMLILFGFTALANEGFCPRQLSHILLAINRTESVDNRTIYAFPVD